MTSRERHISRSDGRERWIANIARARGTILPEVELYIRVGMRPSEIAIARRLQTGVEPDDSYRAKIANAMGHRKRRGLPLRTPAERRKARIDALNETEEIRDERVRLWLDAIALIPKEEWPHTRSGWIEWTDELSDENEKKKWKEEWEEFKVIRTVFDRDDIPDGKTDRHFLYDFIQQRRQYNNPDMGGFYHPNFLVALDPTIPKRLARQMELVTKKIELLYRPIVGR